MTHLDELISFHRNRLKIGEFVWLAITEDGTITVHLTRMAARAALNRRAGPGVVKRRTILA